MTAFPILQPQEIPLDDPQSCEMFMPSEAKPLVATPAAIEMYGQEMILACLQVLQESAVKHGGLDYLQISHGHYTQNDSLCQGVGAAYSGCCGAR